MGRDPLMNSAEIHRNGPLFHEYILMAQSS